MKHEKLYEVADVLPGYPFRGKIPAKINGDTRVVQMKDVESDKPIDWGGLINTK